MHCAKMNLMQFAVILNPAAGRGRGAKMRPMVEKALPDAEIIETKRAGDATELARDAAKKGAQIVVAAGGDGTLGEVLNGIYGSGAKLGILPLGTGNDFARCIGIGTKVDFALEVLKTGHFRAVDVGIIENETGKRFFLNVAGAGFDSRVAARINAHRPAILSKLGGTAAYLVAGICEVHAHQLSQVRLVLDGKVIESRAVLCAIANASSYGGGMRVAPDADLSDGLFDVCLIKDVEKWEFVRAFPGVFSGKHVHHPKVEMFRAAKIEFSSDPPLPILVDGEIMSQTPARFEMVTRAIEIVAPIFKS
jgi:diacylglycerol kinase (ATP)